MRAEKIQRFSDYSDIKKSNPYYLVYTPLIKALVYAVNKYAAGNLLDIGCGNKPYQKMFDGKIDTYVGCDIVQSSEEKVDVLCPANNIPLTDESFNTVFSTQTIEHVADHQGLVNEAYRLVKKGGYFIVSGPLYWHLHEEPYDYFRFTKYGFEHILQKAGFEIVAIQPNGGMWATTGQSIIHAFSKSNGRHFLVRCWRFIFYKCRLHWLVNSFFAWLDKVDFNAVNTMNYVVVAQKK